MKEGMLQIKIAEELESLEQTWRPVVCTIVLKPTLTFFYFLHPHRTLHSFIIYKFLLYVSITRWTNSAELTPDMGHKQNEHWHQPLLQPYNLLPASTQFHVHYCQAQAHLVHAFAGNYRWKT